AAKQDVEDGRTKVKAELDKLGPDLEDLKAELSANFDKKFASLETQITDKRNALVSGIADRYKQALSDADTLLNEVRERNKTFVDAFADAIGGVIGKFIELKEKLLSVFQEGVDTILQILADPITFLGNLIAGVGQGLNNFLTNIGTHLKKGLLE